MENKMHRVYFFYKSLITIIIISILFWLIGLIYKTTLENECIDANDNKTFTMCVSTYLKETYNINKRDKIINYIIIKDTLNFNNVFLDFEMLNLILIEKNNKTVVEIEKYKEVLKKHYIYCIENKYQMNKECLRAYLNLEESDSMKLSIINKYYKHLNDIYISDFINHDNAKYFAELLYLKYKDNKKIINTDEYQKNIKYLFDAKNNFKLDSKFNILKNLIN